MPPDGATVAAGVLCGLPDTPGSGALYGAEPVLPAEGAEPGCGRVGSGRTTVTPPSLRERRGSLGVTIC